jgi:formylglycine-generating enzyme required for sulfatase activity
MAGGAALNPGVAQTKKGKSHALLVGIRDYDHRSLTPLKYTENDVEKLAKLLDRPGSPFRGNVRVLTSTRGAKDQADRPTAANIRKALAALLDDRTRRDTVLLALSGHGVQLQVADPAGKGPEKTFPYFCPSDAQLTKIDYKTGKHPRLINLQELMTQLGDSGAGAKLVLMDACRNELQTRSIRRSLNLKSELVPEGVAALFSCKGGQFSFEVEKLEHGLFFHFVLEGLGGKAVNGDGEVTWGTLAEYVTRQVTRRAPDLAGKGATQTPQEVKNLEGESPLLLPSSKRPPVKKTPEIDRPKIGRVEIIKGKAFTNSIGMKLVPIPVGKFMMGSPKGEKDRGTDEGPLHEVQITKAFHMGAFEVTQAQYRRVMGNNPSHFSATGKGREAVKGHDTSDFPVDSVTWEDAVEFCKRLSALAAEKKAGRLYRLPTEAEWEYACRAGERGSRPFHYGSWLSGSLANINARYPYGGGKVRKPLDRPCRVGSYKPNAWGLYDMHGNVWEWCSDFYGKDYYRTRPKKDPPGPAQADERMSRVRRGGSFLFAASASRSAARAWCVYNFQYNDNGFRVVCVSAAGR